MKFSFKAKTTLSLLELFYSANSTGGIQIGARNTQTGYEHPDCASITKVQGVDVVRLSNKFINEKLIGAKVEGYAKIENYNAAEYSAAVSACKETFVARVIQEIDSLLLDDEVILTRLITGYGSVYSLCNKKLSYEASKEFGETVERLYKKGAIAFVREESDSSYAKVKMSYAEFKELAYATERAESEKANLAEERKGAKFAEATRTGKPVQIYSTFLAGNAIPKNYRDQDSDMGHLVCFAMPDGSTSEEFYHSH